MQINELFPALDPVVSAFDKIGILYYIGGSISSSIHGIPRTTMDIDIIADMDRSFTSFGFMKKVVRGKKMSR